MSLDNPLIILCLFALAGMALMLLIASATTRYDRLWTPRAIEILDSSDLIRNMPAPEVSHMTDERVADFYDRLTYTGFAAPAALELARRLAALHGQPGDIVEEQFDNGVRIGLRVPPL